MYIREGGMGGSEHTLISEAEIEHAKGIPLPSACLREKSDPAQVPPPVHQPTRPCIEETGERDQSWKMGPELLEDGRAINLVERVGQVHLHDQQLRICIQQASDPCNDGLASARGGNCKLERREELLESVSHLQGNRTGKKALQDLCNGNGPHAVRTIRNALGQSQETAGAQSCSSAQGNLSTSHVAADCKEWQEGGGVLEQNITVELVDDPREPSCRPSRSAL
jgi:hypothetical protein